MHLMMNMTLLSDIMVVIKKIDKLSIYSIHYILIIQPTKMTEQFKKIATQMIEQQCKCNINNLNSTEQFVGFGRYIENSKDKAVYLINSVSGLKVGYYFEGVCRYWKLHAFSNEYDEIIAYYYD